jgi:hypothetical protein
MDNNNNKQKRVMEPTPEEFILWGKEIHNKSRCSIGSDTMEDRAFHEFFGTTANVVSKIWGHLLQQDLVPIEGSAKHLLWSLYFMRAYPKERITYTVVGGLVGAIEPNTLQHYIWPFIEVMAELAPDVVSLLCMFFHRKSHQSVDLPFCSRLFSRTGKRVVMSMTVSSALMALTVAFPSKVWL